MIISRMSHCQYFLFQKKMLHTCGFYILKENKDFMRSKNPLVTDYLISFLTKVYEYFSKTK